MEVADLNDSCSVVGQFGLCLSENFVIGWKLRLSGGEKKLKRCEMGEKNCHVCQ